MLEVAVFTVLVSVPISHAGNSGRSDAFAAYFELYSLTINYSKVLLCTVDVIQSFF